MGKGCFNCMRVLVILFNLLFVLFGCAILGVAIFLYVDVTVNSIKDSLEEKFMIDVILLAAMAVGGVTILVSTFGCCGAYHESECLLGTYFFCLFVLVSAEIAAGLVGFIKLDEKSIERSMNTTLLTSVQAYMQTAAEQTPPGHLSNIQKAFACCGANGAKDYVKGETDRKATACGKVAESRLADELPGCTSAVMKWVKQNRLCILIACFSVAAFELLAMLVSLCLCCRVRRVEAGYVGVTM